MHIEHAVLATVIMLLASLLAAPLAARIRIPYAALLVLVGFLGSEIIVGLGYDTGLRAESFHDLIFSVFLPVLIFETAYRIDQKLLLRNLFPVLFLAIVVMMFSAAVTAVVVFYGIGHSAGFPWIAAAITGILLAATDPVSVVSQLRSLGAPQRLTMLLEGESLFNDAVAIVFFGLALQIARMPEQMNSGLAVTGEFLRVFLGGLALGAAIGGALAIFVASQRKPLISALVSVVAAYGAWIVAESLFSVSGVMATLAAGLVLGPAMSRRAGPGAAEQVDFLWDFLGHSANSLVFLLVGVTVTVSMFEQRWLAMAIAIGAVLFARTISIYATVPLLSVGLRNRIPVRYQTVMIWGGLRGAVTLALALALPTDLPYWWTIQSIAFGVVLFTLFIQAPTSGLLLRRLRLVEDTH